jgi:translation initiation factor IF-2
LKLDLKIASLKQNKLNINLVREGEECGIILEGFEEIKEGDIIDCYEPNIKFSGITQTKSVIECYTN